MRYTLKYPTYQVTNSDANLSRLPAEPRTHRLQSRPAPARGPGRPDERRWCRMACVNERYHTLVRLAPDPVFIIDAEGATILETNDRATELLGYDRQTLEGMALSNLHPDENAAAYCALFERLSRGETEELRTDSLPDGSQLFLLTRDGDRIPVELHARTVMLNGGHRIYGIARNITQRYEQRQTLRRQNERLEEFASIVSHDLRNPLSVAQGRLEMAQTEVDSDHLDEVEHAHERMESLISDLLTLARQGESAVECEPVNLADLVTGCWRTVDTAAATLTVETTRRVQADPSRLQQLVENLIRNAVEHAGADTALTVGDLPDGFYVADDGPGIPDTERERVFETGYSTETGGTGFGLGIVAEVVEAHDWDVCVTESAAGGARFEITGVETLERPLGA